MTELLKDKKVIFFDVGYTLDYPLSGDWMFTNKFYESAGDKLNNMDNYIAYPDAEDVLKVLSKTYKLGIISDTWPSIDRQLRKLGVADFFRYKTYSCFLGTFKPDERMYLDALNKCGVPPEDTVFVDDSPENLEGAKKLGITPVLIAANPASDVDSPYLKIRSLSELLS